MTVGAAVPAVAAVEHGGPAPVERTSSNKPRPLGTQLFDALEHPLFGCQKRTWSWGTCHFPSPNAEGRGRSRKMGTHPHLLALKTKGTKSCSMRKRKLTKHKQLSQKEGTRCKWTLDQSCRTSNSVPLVYQRGLEATSAAHMQLKGAGLVCQLRPPALLCKDRGEVPVGAGTLDETFDLAFSSKARNARVLQAGIFLDCSERYERVPLAQLEQFAIERGFPLYALNASLNMHSGRRRILIQAAVSDAVQTCSLPPGCRLAVDLSPSLSAL
eukprot:5089340-Amphidinium_carterae.2